MAAKNTQVSKDFMFIARTEALIAGIMGGVFSGLGVYGNRLVGVICLQLFILFDCIDGEIARHRNRH